MGTDSPPRPSALKGAIIGFGAAAVKAHLPVWRGDERFRIEAVVETASERVRLAERMLPGVVVHPDLDSLLTGNDLDFIDICTPPCFHEKLMLKACAAGLHVFCEKPLIPSKDGLSRLHQAAVVKNRVLFVVNNWKYAPLWVKAVDMVRTNQIGRVKELRLSVLRTPGPAGGISDWRRFADIAGGGVLVDHGWHNLYLAMAIVNDYPVSVSAQMGHRQADDPDVEEAANIILRFPAAAAYLHLNRRAACRSNCGLITCERGVLVINDDHLVLKTGNGDPPARIDFPEALSAGSHHPAWMRAVVEDFYAEVQSPSLRGGNFAEAGWCVRLIDLAYRSHRQAGRFLSTDR